MMIINPEPVIMDRIVSDVIYWSIMLGISYVIGDSLLRLMRLIKKYV